LNVLQSHIEALIFCNEGYLSSDEIQHCLTEMFDAAVSINDIETCIKSIIEKYADDKYPFEVVASGGGYQFLTKPAYQASIAILLKNKTKRKLSTSAIETLSIIAYKQPVTKTDLEQIRGVNCDYSVQKLLEKELIEIRGKSDGVGKPLLYGTTTKFMDYFGINSLDELPQLKDLIPNEQNNEVGEQKEN